MCVGIPMQVVIADNDTGIAYCIPWPAQAEGTETTIVDIRLLGNVTNGQWLLVFLAAARECLSEQRAHQIGQALQALQQIEAGDFSALDDLFADLNREPQLPEHLRPAVTNGE